MRNSMASSVSRGSQVSFISQVEEDDDGGSLHVNLDGNTGPNSDPMGANVEIAENSDLKNEARKTSVIRCLMITTLLTTAAIVANVALIIGLTEEEAEFKAEYKRLSDRLIDHFLEAFAEKVSAVDSLVAQLSFSEAFPGYNVSIPEFEVQAEGIRQLSSSTTVSFFPFLTGKAERQDWEAYVRQEYDEEARGKFESTYMPHNGKYDFYDTPLVSYRDTGDRTVQEGIYHVVDGAVVSDSTSTFFAPVWQVAPFNNVTESLIMFNQMSEERRSLPIQRLLEYNEFVVSDILYNLTMDSLQDEYAAPLAAVYYPVVTDVVQDKASIVGAISLEFAIESLLENVLEGFEDEPLTAVVETSCGSEFSFSVQGDAVTFLGTGDLQENIPDVGIMELISSTYEQFDILINSQAMVHPALEETLCSYRVKTYPTNDFHSYYLTRRPVIIQFLVGLVFLFAVAVFGAYDCLFEGRQRRLLASAQRTNALVSTLFPQGVRDRMYKRADKRSRAARQLEAGPKLRLKAFIMNDSKATETAVQPVTKSDPIADYFPHSTILFADISGFSAWASEREPSQVFTLLETMFTSFDNIARRLGVFKVETVGDCYVAATGIPEARDDHAVMMVRFANAMLHRANDLSKALESTLGPGTADLTLRVGIHSGPVTAGVLRGEKSRFQLFGDTMNSASRMESTSLKGMIQLSTETANLLIEAGKNHWIEPREELVEAKGKGTLQTYWLKTERQDDARKSLVVRSGALSPLNGSGAQTYEAKERLIDWNQTVMISLIEKIVASRGRRRVSSRDSTVRLNATGGNVLGEVKEVIELARFDCQAVLRSEDRVGIPPSVRSELRDYIAQICSLYLDNPFHNFSHASHVIMSAHKLLKRITRPDEVDYSHADKADVAQELHEATYGISSDPLTQLAIVVSALIHDAGHTGVPNGQLAKEHPNFASKYGNQSIAEQRSLDISLELLEAPCYSNLRACIMPTKDEQVRFRQLIINSVMATDIFDKDLGALRKARWAKAFGLEQSEGGSSPHKDSSEAMLDRKATIVLEHVIQASDVAHTMQHWKIYQKWNQNLYEEMYKAFKEGRSDCDPTSGWYKGELWFFDYYVIPLAKKLKECGVFGISSDEYLHYALENRNEWEQKGEAIVERMQEGMMNMPLIDDGDEIGTSTRDSPSTSMSNAVGKLIVK